MKQFLIYLVCVFLVLLAPRALADSAPRAQIDSRVLADTANGDTAHFLVVLKSQANARTLAARAPDQRARGRAVFDGLRAVAEMTQPAVRTQLDALGAPHRDYWITNVIAVEGNRAVVDALAARADVLAIEPDRAFRVELETPLVGETRAPSTVEWNISKINAPLVWARGVTGQGTIYANADTGVQWDHPALKTHYSGWDGSSANHNYAWWDAIHADINGNGTNPCGFNSTAPCDDYGHGTHTMGTGIGDDGAGNQIGVAPGAKWIACRNMEQGYGRPSTYIECMQFFLAPTDLNGNNPDPNKRPDAVGNSYSCVLGAPPSGEDCLVDSLLTAMDNLRAAGVFMSASAGNSGASCSTIREPPAIYDSAITVGATTSTDTIASFSSLGAVTIDGSNRRKPDLVAPGVGVRSSFPGNSFGFSSGTSMASPHVAGAVALLWSAFPSLRRDVDNTEMILEQSAIHLATTLGCGGDSSTAIPNNTFGYGRLDADAAYLYAQCVYLARCNLYLPDIRKNP
ncbi:MAG: S8 family serine peptidase [Chloroflexi bacterium]|nr:S8 family serine peptidase [Chloroflexota bacterium]